MLLICYKFIGIIKELNLHSVYFSTILCFSGYANLNHYIINFFLLY